MKIKYTPLSAKSGLIEHVENTVGRTLIAMAQAEEVKLPPRGSAGWLEARLEQSAMAGAPHRDDTPSGYVQGVEWGVRDRLALNGQVVILRKSGFDTMFFDEVHIKEHGYPSDCPDLICQKFEAVRDGDTVRAEQLAEEQRKQQAYDRSLHGVRRW